MLLIKATILTLSLFSGLSSAQPSTQLSSTDGLQLIDGQRLPDVWHAYDLDDPEGFPLPALEAADDVNTTTTLVAREPVNVCKSSLTRLAECATIASSAFTVTAGIAAAIWAWSHQKDCSYHSGVVDGWRYEYHATGRNCDTTAEQKTIQGAIYRHLKTVEHGKVCGTQCVSLRHGGTWAGYLKFGKEGVFDSSIYCGPTLHFEYCASGGVNSF